MEGGDEPSLDQLMATQSQEIASLQEGSGMNPVAPAAAPSRLWLWVGVVVAVLVIAYLVYASSHAATASNAGKPATTATTTPVLRQVENFTHITRTVTNNYAAAAGEPTVPQTAPSGGGSGSGSPIPNPFHAPPHGGHAHQFTPSGTATYTSTVGTSYDPVGTPVRVARGANYAAPSQSQVNELAAIQSTSTPAQADNAIVQAEAGQLAQGSVTTAMQAAFNKANTTPYATASSYQAALQQYEKTQATNPIYKALYQQQYQSYYQQEQAQMSANLAASSAAS